MNLDDARTCPTCHDLGDVHLAQPLPDGLRFQCRRCQKAWTVQFQAQTRPVFDALPREDGEA
jgi:predicted  nucleic acid-binding Zn ribbon protein